MTWFQRIVKLFAGAADAGVGAERSPKWESVRREYLKDNRECVACGQTSSLEVHHIVPFHLRRDLELVPSNLMSLCRDCHFYFGHLKDWSSWNEHAKADAGDYRQKVRSRP